ncbi:MAG: penicillin acylase family protein [Bacteroidia bacterium]|nr:penicillin acylase family protein [Bacteroidia bacterium]
MIRKIPLLCLILWQTQAQKIEIYRDSFGTPYIFGEKDADCAYGLAWAHAEDDFVRIQYLVALAKGKLGRLIGKVGAATDYFSHFTGAFQLSAQQYDSLSSDVRAVLEGYAAGLNAFAASHPRAVLDRTLFPVKAEDIVRGYIIVLSSMIGAGQALQKTLAGQPEKYEFQIHAGSNAMAVSAKRTEDGCTYLLINPHVPIEGVMRWYEAFLHSEEGWHVLGGFFPCTVAPGLGTTPKLGWGVTFNWPDFVDIYRLRIHPRDTRLYALDGKWDTLRSRTVTLEVRLMRNPQYSIQGWPVMNPPRPWGPVLRVKKRIETSVFGPVVRTKKGVYALRFPVEKLFRAPQQWYEMSKATTFSAFRRALDLQGIPHFNIVCAEKHDTLFYLFNATLPERHPAYNWQDVLPGDTSATLWKRYLSIEELPQVLSPTCGYVFSVNNSPFATTCPEEAPKPDAFPSQHGWHWNRHNNRERRLYELMASQERISWEEFHAIKYDRQYPKEGPVRSLWLAFATLPDTEHTSLQEAVRLIRDWDFTGLGGSRAATLLTLAGSYALKKMGLPAYNWLEEGKLHLPTDLLWESLAYATRQLRRFYHRVDPPLGEVQALEVKGKRYPLDGLPEQLAPAYAEWDMRKGFLRVLAGDTYIQFVRFSPDTPYPYVESVLPLGISGDSSSPHYDDQLPLYLSRRCKPMTLDPGQIRSRFTRTKVLLRRER